MELSINSDVIINRPSDHFTIIPNSIIRNTSLSGTAVKIMAIMMSNDEGWKSSFQGIQKYMKEGRESIRTGMSLLKKEGYISTFQIIDRRGKIKSTFYAVSCTPGVFDLSKKAEELKKHRLKIRGYKYRPTGNPEYGKPGVRETRPTGNPSYGKPGVRETRY